MNFDDLVFYLYSKQSLFFDETEQTVNPITVENTVKHDIIKVKKDGPMEIGP